MKRRRGAIRSVGQGFFPLDEALARGSEGWTSQVQEWMVQLGACIPSFGKAAELVEARWIACVACVELVETRWVE